MAHKIGKFYIVATPIGNLKDITLRAIETLNNVDLILCEDTRVTKILMRHHEINKPLFVYNDHSDETLRKKIIDKILQGENIALVSDAGTPLISDPGYKLIHDLKRQNIKVETLPGACSVIAALTISGLPTDRFMFLGFLPPKSAAKETLFTDIKEIKATMVFFESANRLINSLEIMKNYFATRNIAVVREISKLYEESYFGKLDEVISYYQNNKDKLKGEIVLCIGPSNNNEETNDDELLLQLFDAMKKMSLRDAVDAVSSQYKIPKKQIYKLALTINNENS